MKKLFQLSAVLIGTVALALTGCRGGGGGNSSTGGVYFTHEELAKEFVYRLYVDKGYDVELVKSNTLQYDYIVVYDYDYGTYDAYYIGAYNPGENLGNYLASYNYKFYYDLDPIGNNQYQDWYTGIIFEKTNEVVVDRMTIAAVKEMHAIEKSANRLVMNYGMPEAKALEVVTKTAQLKQAQKKGWSEQYYANFLRELTGTDLKDWEDAISAKANGDGDKLSKLLKKTNEVMGIDVGEYLEKEFGVGL